MCSGPHASSQPALRLPSRHTPGDAQLRGSGPQALTHAMDKPLTPPLPPHRALVLPFVSIQYSSH